MGRPELAYEAIVNELLSSLHHEVLIIGVFVVAFGHLRHAMRERRLLTDVRFWQRLVLLSVITLFSSYIAITYFLEGEVLLSKTEIRDALADLCPTDREHAKQLVVVMMPIDLLGVLCMAALYVVLARDDFFFDKTPESPYPETDHALVPLFTLTAVWHLLMVLWWTVFSSLGVRDLATGHMLYHAAYVAGHAVGALALWRLAPLVESRPVANQFCQWGFVALYTVLTMSVYAYRTYLYVGVAIGDPI